MNKTLQSLATTGKIRFGGYTNDTKLGAPNSSVRSPYLRIIPNSRPIIMTPIIQLQR